MSILSSLAWLPSPPANFRERCKIAGQGGPAAGAEIRALAQFALDGNQLNSLARAIASARKSGCALEPLAPFRLGLLGHGTLDFIAPAIVASAARYGFALDCIKGDYDQILQDAVSPGSAVNRARPDAVLIAADYRGLPIRSAPGSGDGDVDAAMQFLAAVRNGVHEHSGAPCIVQTIPAPPEALFGSFDRLLEGTVRRTVETLNAQIGQSILGSSDILLDVSALAQAVGLANWHDPRQWNMAKLSFDADFLPLYAEHVARTIAAIRGKSRRCLILDLDNTVWGGVIGDDGLEGIQIAQGDAVGEAFLSVQSWALALRERGVVLAVSSKNNDDVARTPFKSHPEMLLRENHIAVFQANWNDKATNIKAIAEELSLGLDAMVLLDDNPAERGLVRELLPQVAVPELPDDPALYVRTLAAAGYFEALAFSAEDRQRAEFYQENARRVSLRQQAGDVQSYLASLQMEISFQPFEPTGRARIAQLINKSNQFNLTTRRYTEVDVAEAERDPAVFTLQVRLTDIFGDNGMISVIVCRPADRGTWDIDTWLMSCRVLGRGVERAVLSEILQEAAKRGVHTVVGWYRATERNSLVENHYRDLGFTLVERKEDGSSQWSIDVGAQVEAQPMTVRRLNAEALSA